MSVHPCVQSQMAISAGEGCEANSLRDRVLPVIVSLALASLAGVATYFCFVNGFPMLDAASTGLATFKAGLLIYTGLALSIVPVGNLLYAGYRACGSKVGNYRDAAVQHIGASLFAPVAMLPWIFCKAADLGIVRSLCRRG